MSGDERPGLERDLEREERVARVLRRPLRDPQVPPFSRIEARLDCRTPFAVIASAAVALVVIALVVGNVLAQRQIPVAEPGPVPTATPVPSAAVGTASPSPTVLPSPTASPDRTVSMPTSALISAPARNVVWVLVGNVLLFRSTDRGDTWERRPLASSASIADVSFVSEREGWVLGAGSPATQCQIQSIELWHTADAGASYESVDTSGAERGCKGPLSFIDERRGFLAAWQQKGAALIYRTTDGGRTWTATALPDPPGLTARDFTLRAGRVHAFGSSLLVEVDGDAVREHRRWVFGSEDGGASWSHVADLPTDIAMPVAFVTASRWIQIITSGQSRETTDGGATWHAFESDYSQAAPVGPATVFADAEVGYATVRGGLQRTVDGGAHWETLDTPGTR